jgi:hypothetical protein
LLNSGLNDSYSHDFLLTAAADQADINQAKRLAAALLVYRVPKDVDPSTLSGYHNYLEDFDELPVSDNRVQQKLDNCRCMVLICSEQTKNNNAIQQRLEYFAMTGRRAAIIPVLVAGESKDSIPQFFSTRRTVQRILADGSTETITEIVKPVASDLRGKSNSEQKQMLAYETVRIVAALAGLHPDDLERRHERRRRQRFAALVLSIGGVSVAAVVIFLILGFSAYNEGNIAQLQTEASAKTITRIIDDLPAQAGEVPGATAVVDASILDTLDALVANGSTNLAGINTGQVLTLQSDDAASIILKKASLLRRLGSAEQANAAYQAAAEQSALLSKNQAVYNNACRYALSGDKNAAGCLVCVLDYDSDVSPIAKGEVIVSVNDEAFAKYLDYQAITSELIPKQPIKVLLITDAGGSPTTRTQQVTPEQLALLNYIVL